MPTLRPYQTQAIAEVRGALGFLSAQPCLGRTFSSGRPSPFHAPRRALNDNTTLGGNVLLVVPTGGGKTVVFAEIARLEQRRRVLIVAHRRELIRQASAKLTAAGVPHGIIAPGYPVTDHAVQVASVQTLARRPDRMRGYGVIIVDEAHHSVAGAWRKVIDANPGARVMGVTATPLRLDGRGLGRAAGGVFDSIVLGPTIAALQAEGFLVRARVFGPARKLDVSGLRSRAGDFASEDVEVLMGRPQVVGDAVAEYGRLCPGKPAIAFCASVKHAEVVAAAFCAGGYHAVSVSGDSPDNVRDSAIAGLADGSVQVLCCADLISEGLDVPAVACVILLRPTKSLCLHVQQVGRGLRPADDKTELVVLDHAGNSFRHGLPDEVHEWTLEGRKKKRKDAPAIRQCPKCFAVHRPAPACVQCGHTYKDDAAAKGRAGTPKQRAGQLEELTPERVRLLRETPIETLLAAATSQRDLHQVAKARGYKAGWAYHKWQEKKSRRKAA